MAVLQAAANARRLPLWRHLAGEASVTLPLPEIQIFGGGAHAGRRIDLQDLMVMPIGAHSMQEALAMVADVYRTAGELMADSGRRAGVADEGGWWPDFSNNEEALQMLTRSIDKAGYRHGEVMISLDIAASEFGGGGIYRPGLEGRPYPREEWIAVLLDWIEWEGPIVTDAEKSRREGLLPPDDAAPGAVAEHLREFAGRAWRRPVEKGELDGYLESWRSEIGRAHV